MMKILNDEVWMGLISIGVCLVLGFSCVGAELK